MPRQKPKTSLTYLLLHLSIDAEVCSRHKGTVLISDSGIGAVWKLDIKDGTCGIAVQIEEMQLPAPPGMPRGINGLRFETAICTGQI
ncbi:MAG: hypothetical protein CL912_11995 [Deltaproteobacteria bacterium]|nr:hypothetical protein [Deltaproteobacteria bacterium]